ncbi:hypothetical protein LINGRAHAP2_LOCUS33221 [Linum grandiflorum]
MNTDAGMLGLFGEVQKPQEQPKPKKGESEASSQRKVIGLAAVQSAMPGETSEVSWASKFVLLAMGGVLCPGVHSRAELKYLLIKLTDFKDYNWCGHVVQHFRSEMKTLLTSTSLTTANIDFNLLMICVCQKFSGKPKQKLEGAPLCSVSEHSELEEELNKLQVITGGGVELNLLPLVPPKDISMVTVPKV